ncbi:uncharacterized protein V6R79_017710 [Siganus canaliculatus]
MSMPESLSAQQMLKAENIWEQQEQRERFQDHGWVPDSWVGGTNAVPDARKVPNADVNNGNLSFLIYSNFLVLIRSKSSRNQTTVNPKTCVSTKFQMFLNGHQELLESHESSLCNSDRRIRLKGSATVTSAPGPKRLLRPTAGNTQRRSNEGLMKLSHTNLLVKQHERKKSHIRVSAQKSSHEPRSRKSASREDGHFVLNEFKDSA